MLFFLASLPIAVIVIGMVGLNRPSKVMAPICWAIALLCGALFFGALPQKLFATSYAGFLDGLRIVGLIFAAFTLLMVMTRSGAMDDIKGGLARVTLDMRLMVLLLAIPFGTFLEGAAGAGTPAALAAPFLVGLGMNPVLAATACLIGNSCPVSWGGAGVTTVVGASASGLDFQLVSSMTGAMMCFAYVILPMLMILFVFGRRGFRGIWRHILFLGLLMGAVNYAMSNVFVSVTELTSLIGGLVGTGIFSLYLSRTDSSEIPAEFRFAESKRGDEGGKSGRSFGVAILPYVFLCILLVTVRLSFPLKALVSFGGGYTVWVACVIFASAIFAAILFRECKSFGGSAVSAFGKVIPALISMGFLLAMVNCMKVSGQISVLASTLSSAAGVAYPMVAVLIGQIGSFVTGTNLGSNLMFNPMHIEAARSLSLNVMPVVAAQNTGGAIGNMICPNNVVAVCACVGVLGAEGKIMRRTLMPSLCLLLFLGTLAMFYSYVVFPL